MATIIRLPQQKKSKSALHKEIKKYDKPGRNPDDASYLRNDIGPFNIVLSAITNIFSSLVQKYVLSHDTDIGDTFVAATALHYQLPLLTMNINTFQASN